MVIDDYAFYGCSNLDVVVLPRNVNIGQYAFDGANMSKMLCPSVTEPYAGSNALGSLRAANGKLFIPVNAEYDNLKNTSSQNGKTYTVHKCHFIDDTSTALNCTDGEAIYNMTRRELTLNSVNIARTFSTSVGAYMPLYLPFDIDYSDLGMTVAQLVSITGDNDGITLNWRHLSAGDRLYANTPYIVKPTQDVSAITASNVTISAEETTLNGTFTDGNYTVTLTGVFTHELVKGRDGKYVMTVNNQFQPCAYDGMLTLKPMRFFLEYTVPSSINNVKLRMTIDDEDASEQIEIFASDIADGAYFDLQGRKVQNPDHGIFILKGKKVIR